VKVWLDPETGELVWQAGFIGQESLQTLIVEELSLHDATVAKLEPIFLTLGFNQIIQDDPEYNSLEHFSPSGQQPLEDPAVEGFRTSKCMQTSPPAGIKFF
jgi:hypothetical protein